jgi:hypothetical protein
MSDDRNRLELMIVDLRRMRNSCEPKNNSNPTYHAYSAAVSAIRRVINDLPKEGVAA